MDTQNTSLREDSGCVPAGCSPFSGRRHKRTSSLEKTGKDFRDHLTYDIVKNLGYSDNVIKKAMEILYKTTQNLNFHIEQLLEVIFGMEEEAQESDNEATERCNDTMVIAAGNSKTNSTARKLMEQQQETDEIDGHIPKISDTVGNSALKAPANPAEVTQCMTDKSKGTLRENPQGLKDNGNLKNVKDTLQQEDAATPKALSLPPANGRKVDEAVNKGYTRMPSKCEIVAKTPEERQRLESLVTERDTQLKKIYCNKCLRKKIEVLFLPCRHLVACENCSTKMDSCMKCQRNIVGTVKIFL